MTQRPSIFIAALAVVLLDGLAVITPSLAGEENTALAEALRVNITRQIERLDAESFAERDGASRALIEIGQPAVGLLDEASLKGSAEVRTRAAMILRHINRPVIQTGFIELARQPDSKIDLEQGMWLISRILNPQVRRVDLDRQLDEIANRVRTTLGKDQDPKQTDPRMVVDALRKVVFDEYGFKGNVADYDNPDNSSLDRVLSSRKGLPILLSQVVIAIGRRLGVPIVGLPTPGRFIVKYDGAKAPADFPKQDIFLDPFGGGRVLERADLAQLFPGIDLTQPLQPGANREAIRRMLSNLESHLFGRNQNEKAFLAVECAAILDEQRPAKDGP